MEEEEDDDDDDDDDDITSLHLKWPLCSDIKQNLNSSKISLKILQHQISRKSVQRLSS
jgi:hypothetical protein